jgi:hypothetical protein
LTAFLGIALVVATIVVIAPADADAQVRVARPRPAGRSTVVVRSRPTVFVGGYYYPTFYRPSLWYGAYGYPYYPYYYGASYYGPSYSQWGPYPYRYDLSGSLRLQVEPRETEVFIDGYYAGQVDDFDGIFQRLRLEPGDHELELYLPGHRTVVRKVYLQPGRTFRIRHDMEPLGPGDPIPARPTGATLPEYDPRGPLDPRPQAPLPRANEGRRQDVPGDSQFGELSLRVQPADAEILIDGERWDAAPGSERLTVQLGAALHRLEIRKAGYRSYFTDVTIRGNETLTLNVALTRQ